MATGKKLGEAFVEIRARIGRFNQDLDKALSRVRKFVDNAQAKLHKIGSGMVSVGRQMAVGISLPLAGLSAAILKFASDAEESENLFRVSMGSMSDAAAKWSDELERSLGVSRTESRRTIGVFQNMITSIGFTDQAAFDMSKQLVELGHDMASFHNLSTEEAFTKLQAGIVGEIEPLRRLGIVLSEATIQAFALEHGITKNAKAMTEAEKVLARFGVILERTGNAQGDMLRTLTAFANQMRIFGSKVKRAAEELGKGFLPIVAAVMGAVNAFILPLAKLIGKFFQLNPVIATVTAAMVALAIALPPVIIGLGLLAIASSALIKILPQLAVAASIAWKAIWGPIGLIVFGITLITTAYYLLIGARKKDAESAKTDAKAVVDAERKKMQDLLAIRRGAEFSSTSGEGLGLFGRAAAASASITSRQNRPMFDMSTSRPILESGRQAPAPSSGATGDKAVSLLQQAVDALLAIKDQTMSASLA